jgi:hypothetical protein
MLLILYGEPWHRCLLPSAESAKVTFFSNNPITLAYLTLLITYNLLYLLLFVL